MVQVIKRTEGTLDTLYMKEDDGVAAHMFYCS
jgi:hypothetical protein